MKLSKVAQKWNKDKKNTYVEGGSDFDGFLRLDIGEPWLPLTPELENMLIKLSVDDFKRRPDIHCLKLCKAASKFWKIPVKNIAVANGSDQFIWLLPRLFMNPDDTAIVINPTFFLFSESVIRSAGRIIPSATSYDNGFQVTDQLVSEIINSAKQNSAKIIWLCNPNNPTGTQVSLEKIRRIAKNTTALVVVDEAFFDISDLPKSESATTLINDHENIVILKALSKTFGLNNVRVGFAIAHRKIIKILENWRLPFEVSGIAQEIGCILLKDVDHLEDAKREILVEKQWLLNQIEKITNIEVIAGTKTTIFLMKHKTKNLFRLLLDQEILTADFDMCRGIERMGFVRISVREREKNEVLLNTLRRVDKV